MDNQASRQEQQRLELLKSLNILDTDPEEAFDRIVRASAEVCGTPMAIISLIDEGRQWLKASVGLHITETPRSIAFCDYTIRSASPFIVPDTAADPQFRDHPLVTGAPEIRFYAGFPLLFPQAHAVGSLAVMDVAPRTLEPSQLAFMAVLAQQVTALLEMRRQGEELRRALEQRDALNARLKAQAEHLRQAQHLAKVGSWEWDPASGELSCSEEMANLLARAPHSCPRRIGELLQDLPEHDRAQLASAIAGALRTHSSFAMDHRIAQTTGEVRHMRSRVTSLEKEHGEAALSGILQDITEERRAQERLLLLDASISRISDTVMITQADCIDEPGPRIVFVNQAFETLTGYQMHEVLGRSPRLLQGPRTSRDQLDRIRSALLSRAAVSAELVNYRKDGREFWLEIHISPVISEEGRVSHFVSVQRDITRRKAAEREIERLAFYDQLTGLPNRRLLLDRLRHGMENVRRSGLHGALILIDLDNFKALNDTHGHDMGDLLLQQVARRLEGVAASCNTVARLGGDEFVVVLEDLGQQEHQALARAEQAAENILAVFGHQFDLAGVEYHCTPSIGVTLFHSGLADIGDLFKRADLAMYQAKAAGRNAARFFDPQIQAIIDARSRLQHDLHAAYMQHEFVLHYQPQADMQEQIIGAEALLRWFSPKRGLVQPHAFLPLAEETGLISQIGQWVLTRACERLKSWSEDPRTAHLSLSVNISAMQFRHPRFVEEVQRVLQASGADPRKLKLEVTETVLIDELDDAIRKMKALKDCGLSFSLDDFGTGYSSLSYLRQLPLDQIKIDKSFISEIVENRSDAAIIRSIVDLGKVLGLDVIAEGVETEEQRDVLQAYGCMSYQGYLLSKPVMPAEFSAFL